MRTESVIEEVLSGALLSSVRTDALVLSQYEVPTTIGKFRLDFAISFESKIIAVECDGRAYHDRFRDEVRDAAILSQSAVETVYRFGGREILDHHTLCIAMIAAVDSYVIDPTWIDRYQRLIHKPSFLKLANTPPESVAEYIGLQISDENENWISCGRRSKIGDDSRYRYHWKSIARRIQELSVTSIDEFVATVSNDLQ